MRSGFLFFFLHESRSFLGGFLIFAAKLICIYQSSVISLKHSKLQLIDIAFIFVSYL